jgi:geranylgeranylglycerol-phosphate geranylgeranyltransferase
MLTRLVAAVEITRPHNMAAAALSVVVGYVVAGGGDVDDALVAAAVTALVTGAGNVINDCYDVSIDRVNKPRRPLPSERLGRRAAFVYYAALTVAACAAAAALLPARVAWLVVAWQAALFGYAARAKRVFVAGNVLVAAIASSGFLAGAILAGHPGAALVPMVIAFVFVMSREVVKGGEDLAGDAAAGVHTLAVRLGPRRAAAVAAGLMLFLAAALPAPAIAGYYGPTYFWLMEALVVPLLVVAAVVVVRRPERRAFARVSWMLKVGMFVGILAIAAGQR